MRKVACQLLKKFYTIAGEASSQFHFKPSPRSWQN